MSVDVSITYTNTGGGSGGGFIGKVKLKKGIYKIKVGAGQTFNNYTYNADNMTTFYYYNKPESSYIEGVVYCTGASMKNAGPKPTLNVTPLEETLNRAGNNGSNNATVLNDANSTTGIVVGESIYQGYGRGSGQAMAGKLTAYPGTGATAGYVKIVKA